MKKIPFFISIGGMKMLQYPTNFYPENIAIDTNAENHIEFTFNGDFLTAITFRVYNYMTGESGDSYTISSNHVPGWYNGDKVMVEGLSNLTNGDDYTIEMLLTQTDNSGTPLYDMPVLSGTIYSVQASQTTSIFIADHISSIYEWDKSTGVKKPVKYNDFIAAGMIIKINNESRFIESYNTETGEIILNSSFSFAVTEGMKYTIKSNYLISAQYFFRCRSVPTITPSLRLFNNFNNYDFIADATYNQAENSLINYYRLYLYYSDTGTFHLTDSDYPLIASTDKIYSQKIEYIFRRVIQTEYYTSKGNSHAYKLICEVVTQDGMTSKGECEFKMPSTNAELSVSDFVQTIDKDKQLFRMVFNCNITGASVEETPDNGRYARIIRKNSDTGESQFIATIGARGGRYAINDYTLPTHGNYVYRISGILGNGAVCGGSVEIPVSPELIGYTITAINQDTAGRYSAGDTWRFSADIKTTTIAQNIDRYLHIGYGQYPITSSTDVNYQTGTLSGMLGYMNCETKEYTDDITLVREWRKFIAQPIMFMLKSQKGDVWFVNITDTPTTEYQEDHYKIPTSFSFNWVEVTKNITVTRTGGIENGMEWISWE